MNHAGRPPVPTWLKELRGTLPAAGNVGEPQPEAMIYIPPPREIADQALASEFWEVHLPLLVKNKMITEVDMTAFVVCCLAYQSWIQAEQQLAKPKEEGGGYTVETKNGYQIQSPWVSIAAARRKDFVEMIREFGLTPSSRTRIKIQLIGSGMPAHHGSAGDEHQGFFEF
jgi:P27 family predicted phage terminase small subunit